MALKPLDEDLESQLARQGEDECELVACARPTAWRALKGTSEERTSLTGGAAGSTPGPPASTSASGISWQAYACAAALVNVLAIVALALLAATALFRTRAGDSAYRIHFLVVGDWGRNGMYNQSLVAAAMGRVEGDLDFILSVGDNFYESGLTSVLDSQFDSSFKDVYTAPNLQVPWHAVLGNHDAGELWSTGATMPQPTNCPAKGSNVSCSYGPLSQLDVRLADRDARWHCERFFMLTLAGGQVDMFFIDTSPGVASYREAPWAANPGGILEQSWEAQLLELEGRLARSRARWKLVIGHHPIRAQLQEFPEVGAALEPLLARYAVAAYLCGHEHNLQHLTVPGRATHYVVSGGGSQVSPAGSERGLRPEVQLFHAGSGFVEAVVTDRELQIRFFSHLKDDPIYSISIP